METNRTINIRAIESNRLLFYSVEPTVDQYRKRGNEGEKVREVCDVTTSCLILYERISSSSRSCLRDQKDVSSHTVIELELVGWQYLLFCLLSNRRLKATLSN